MPDALPPTVHPSTHPLVAHKLSLLRDRTTEPKKFRELVRELSWLLGYEAMADLATEPYRLETPIEPMDGTRLGRRSAWCRCCAPGWAWSRPCSS